MRYSDPRKYENLSRYRVYRQILSDDTYLESFNQKEIEKSDGDVYHIVTKQEENRLDMISNNYYGTPEYWWILAIANNFIDPFVLTSGTSVRIPPLDVLFTWNGVLHLP